LLIALVSKAAIWNPVALASRMAWKDTLRPPLPVQLAGVYLVAWAFDGMLERIRAEGLGRGRNARHPAASRLGLAFPPPRHNATENPRLSRKPESP